MKPLSTADGLIVCAGRDIGDLCKEGVPQIAATCPDLSLRFVISDWLDEDQICSAVVYWVLDVAAGLDDIRIALRCGIPLLVPEQSELLKQVCVEGNCGLFYQNEEEAIACVIYLLRNPGVRVALGQNARRISPDSPISRDRARAGGR